MFNYDLRSPVINLWLNFSLLIAINLTIQNNEYRFD